MAVTKREPRPDEARASLELSINSKDIDHVNAPGDFLLFTLEERLAAGEAWGRAYQEGR